MNNFSLESKTAFVLGGSGLIGHRVSIELAKAGAEVLILDKDLESSKKTIKEVKKFNKRCNATFFDCSEMDKLDKEFKKVISKHSVPDIFINCSYPRTKDWAKNSFQKVKLDSFRKNVDIHLNSYVWTAKVMASEMVKKKIKGSIILTSSIYGQRAQDMTIYEGTKIENNMSYSVIKSGIINLSRQMASYYGSFGLRINTVCPGGLEGPIAGKRESQDNLFKKRYIKKTPLKRMANPLDVANAMVFLSSEASSYITGQEINVDGGISIV